MYLYNLHLVVIRYGMGKMEDWQGGEGREGN